MSNSQDEIIKFSDTIEYETDRAKLSLDKTNDDELRFTKSSTTFLPPVQKKRRKHTKLELEIPSVSSSLERSVSVNSNDKATESSESEPQSYRQKVRERFKPVKDRAGSSSSRAQELHKFRLSGNIRKSLELLKEENISIDADIKAKLLDKSNSVSLVERYNFFCEEGFIEQQTGQSQDEIFYADGSNQDLVETFDSNTIVYCQLPNLLADYVEIAENDFFWKPKRALLPIQAKLDHEPRYLSEEGLYVSRIPKISYLNVLEQRLLSLDDKKWFNCDGNLKMLESPVSRKSYRPIDSHFFELQTEYRLPSIGVQGDDDICRSVYVSDANILQINIVNIKFEHHPLFSAEHVFERRLLTFYDTHREKCIHNNIERTSKKLEAVRKARNSHNISDGSGDKNNENIYTGEVMKLREQLFKEGKEYRDNVKLILQTWKIIKQIRSRNVYSNTAIKLTIHKDKCSFEREKEIWEERIKQVISDVILENRVHYENDLIKYKEKIKKWKAEKRSDEVLDVSTKPKKPSANINEEDVKHVVIEQFKQSFKPPGEPALKFSISYDNEITKEVDDENEKLRRHAVTKTKMYIKIICGGITVCKSKLASLNDTFSCFIDQSISLQMSIVPNKLLIEVYEQSSALRKRKISDVFLNIPPRAVKFSKEKVVEEEFEKDEVIEFNHEGVGSRQELSKITEKFGVATSENCSLRTLGSIRYYVGWDDSDNRISEIIDVSESNVCRQTVLNENGCIDVNKLADWTEGMKIDPQDPKNIDLFEYINTYESNVPTSTHPTAKKYFRCSPNLQPLILYESTEIENNLRFKVLQLRNRNEPNFVGMSVPNRIKEIPSNILSVFKKRSEEESKDLDVPEDACDKTVDGQRVFGRKRLKEIYTKVFQKCKSAENNLEYDDVVNEKLISYFEHWINAFAGNFFNWFKIKPNVNKPLPKYAKLSTSQEQVTKCVVAHINVVVEVISAVNVPKRTKSKKHSKSSPNSNPTDATDNVSSFIEASYKNVVLRTAVKETINPKWDEELIFQLESSNTDYQSPNSLNGSIVLNLFSEFIDITDETKQTNWLGYVHIPLSAICHSGKLEGYFRVTSPIVNIYEQSNDKLQNYVPRNTTNLTATYMFLKLWMEPKIPKLTISMSEMPSSEPSYLQKYILEWNEKHNANYPYRKFSAFAIDVNGKTLCLTRFIRPLEPPQMNENDFDVTPEQCARYISLIPFTCINKLYDHIWLSTEQMFNFMLGSVFDHAVALTCFFLALNLDTWLLLGYGLPNCLTGYVLVREYSAESDAAVHFVYDVETAIKYSVTESFCPLQKIFAVVNDSNIWANVQSTNDLNLTRLDFMNRSDWCPLFNNQMCGPTNTIQQKLVYNNTYNSANEGTQLKFQIEKRIRRTIGKLRATRTTIWNNHVSRILRDVMIKSEYKHVHGKFDMGAYVQSIEATHKINGFVIDLPYVNLSTIGDVVKRSKVFNADVSQVEFVSAVHIHSYPSRVFVVWIVLGYIIYKQ